MRSDITDSGPRDSRGQHDAGPLDTLTARGEAFYTMSSYPTHELIDRQGSQSTGSRTYPL